MSSVRTGGVCSRLLDTEVLVNQPFYSGAELENLVPLNTDVFLFGKASYSKSH